MRIALLSLAGFACGAPFVCAALVMIAAALLTP
jgi:hypothetical protein